MSDDTFPAPTLDDVDLVMLARDLGPLKVDRAGYVWARSLKGGDMVIANIRGWGYLTGGGDGALGMTDAAATIVQRQWGELIVRAVNKLAEAAPLPASAKPD